MRIFAYNLAGIKIHVYQTLFSNAFFLGTFLKAESNLASVFPRKKISTFTEETFASLKIVWVFGCREASV